MQKIRKKTAEEVEDQQSKSLRRKWEGEKGEYPKKTSQGWEKPLHILVIGGAKKETIEPSKSLLGRLSK